MTNPVQGIKAVKNRTQNPEIETKNDTSVNKQKRNADVVNAHSNTMLSFVYISLLILKELLQVKRIKLTAFRSHRLS